MSRYGINFYGPGSFYGEAPLTQFDARPVSAQSPDYGQILVTWMAPSGSWDTLRVTRDAFGFAPRADMGVLLLEIPKTNGQTSYLDIGLQEGKFFYYTIWVRDVTVPSQPTWKRAGDVIGLVTKDWGYRERMFELVPMVYRDKDGDTTQVNGRGQLERFFDIFGFQADHVRTEYETLTWVNDPSKVSGGLLPLMADQFGFGYETELGMRLARQQMQNVIYIYKHKGTEMGIDALVSVLTGWAPTITTSYNLLLGGDDSSFETGTGNWVNISNTTLGVRTTSDSSSPGMIAGPVPPPSGASIGDIGSGNQMLLLTAIGAGDMTVQSYPSTTAASNQQYGIPVDPVGVPVPIVFAGGLDFTYSIYAQALDTTRSVKLGIQWFDITGTSLGAVTENTAVSVPTGSWTRLIYSAIAPLNAAFALLQIHILSAATGNRIVFDAVQFEQSPTARAYEAARAVRIYFAADRVNLLVNASAELDTSSWTAFNATLARTTATFEAGAASFQLTASSAANMTLRTLSGLSGMAVTPGTYYTASGYSLAATVGRASWIGLEWYDNLGRVIMEFPPWGTVVAGISAVNNTTTWTRVSATALAPSNAAYARLVMGINSPANGEVHYFDAFLLESGTALQDFFDGSTYSTEGEYIYTSPPSGPSYFYSRRLIKNYRVNQRLPEFLPAGATYTLLYAAQT